MNDDPVESNCLATLNLVHSAFLTSPKLKPLFTNSHSKTIPINPKIGSRHNLTCSTLGANAQFVPPFKTRSLFPCNERERSELN